MARTREAQSPNVNPVYISRQVAEARARAAARTPRTQAAASNAPVYSALMARSDFEALVHTHNEAINAQRMVWVVTVHAPKETDGSPARAPAIKDVYSVAIDAETGHWTDECIGCAWVDQSK